jgi:hypothetical protein
MPYSKVMNKYTYAHIIRDDNTFGVPTTFRYFEAISSMNDGNSVKESSVRPDELGAWLTEMVDISSRTYLGFY